MATIGPSAGASGAAARAGVPHGIMRADVTRTIANGAIRPEGFGSSNTTTKDIGAGWSLAILGRGVRSRSNGA